MSFGESLLRQMIWYIHRTFCIWSNESTYDIWIVSANYSGNSNYLELWSKQSLDQFLAPILNLEKKYEKSGRYDLHSSQNWMFSSEYSFLRNDEIAAIPSSSCSTASNEIAQRDMWPCAPASDGLDMSERTDWCDMLSARISNLLNNILEG